MPKSFMCLVSMIASLFAATAAKADYNANVLVHITEVLTYGDNHFLIATDATPVVSGCSYYFIVTASTEDALNRLYARALTAKVSHESINIGYDSTSAGCASTGWLPVHRLG